MSEGAAQTDDRSRTRRGWALIAFAVGAVLLLGYYLWKTPTINGDGWEYLNQVESLHTHGTPELRQDDLLIVDSPLQRGD